MKITRNVVADLLPVYLSGEASADTRTLIDEFLRTDLEFAREVEEQKRALAEQENLLKAGKTELARDHEVQTLIRTKSMLERRRWLLALACMFTGFPFSFAFEGQTIKFLLVRDAPGVALVCWGLAAVFWVIHFRTKNKLRTSGL